MLCDCNEAVIARATVMLYLEIQAHKQNNTTQIDEDKKWLIVEQTDKS